MAVETQEDLAREYAKQGSGESQADLAREYATQGKGATSTPGASPETQLPGMIGSIARFGQQAQPYMQTLGREASSAADAIKGLFTAPYQAMTSPMSAEERQNFPLAANAPGPLGAFGKLGLTANRMVADPIANAGAWYINAAQGKIPNATDQMLSVLPEGIGTAAGTEVGGKLAQSVPSVPKLASDFMRRAQTASDIAEAASGHYKSTIQPAIQTLAGALQREGAKTLDQAISADRAAQTVQGRGTISAAPAILEAAKAVEETGHLPSPATRTLLNKLNSQSLMTLEDAKNLRSDFGEAASRVRQNNPKAYKILRTAYEELGNGMRDRIQELQGSTKPFDHYNNEFRAYYELREGIAGQMMQSIADRHEAIPQLKDFSNADLTEIKAQMKKYGMNPDYLAKAQKQARSIVAASDSINGRLNKSAYRLLLGGGLSAATVASVIAVSKGAGLYGMLPMALGAYAGSRIGSIPEQMEAGRVLSKLRMTPNASQIRTLVEGPQNYQYGGPEFEGFKGGSANPPPVPMAGGLPSTATQAGANISNDFFSQAKAQMPNASLSEQLQAAAKMEKAARIQSATPQEVESTVEQERRGAAPERPHRSPARSKMELEDWQKVQKIEEIQARRGVKKAEMEKGSR